MIGIKYVLKTNPPFVMQIYAIFHISKRLFRQNLHYYLHLIYIYRQTCTSLFNNKYGLTLKNYELQLFH